MSEFLNVYGGTPPECKAIIIGGKKNVKQLVNYRVRSGLANLKTEQYLMKNSDYRANLQNDFVRMLLTVDDEIFIQMICKTISLKYAYGLEMRMIFFHVVSVLEALVSKILPKHVERYAKMKTDSSSNILLMFGREGHKHLKPSQLSEYLKKGKFDYKGFCPYEPSYRMSQLCYFPLDLAVDYVKLPEKSPLGKTLTIMTDGINMIQDYKPPPTTKTRTEPKISNSELTNMGNLIDRYEKHMDHLSKLEIYYTDKVEYIKKIYLSITK